MLKLHTVAAWFPDLNIDFPIYHTVVELKASVSVCHLVRNSCHLYYLENYQEKFIWVICLPLPRNLSQNVCHRANQHTKFPSYINVMDALFISTLPLSTTVRVSSNDQPYKAYVDFFLRFLWIL